MMAYCPSCRSEYRPEFNQCKNCGGVALVEALPEVSELREDELDDSLPVGFTESGSDRPVEVDGRVIDPWRVFDLDTASKVKAMLGEAGIPSAIVPLEGILFPDGRPRFEVRVRGGEQASAERFLLSRWQETVAAEGVEVVGVDDVEKCPACGGHVPLSDEECPECGLVVGTGTERGAQAEV
jgi:hypothetical protein